MTDTHIEFPEPCHEDWDAMHPLGRARHCDNCDKPVHDLTQYTPEEADAVIQGAGGPACLRAQIAADGRVLTKPSRMGKLLMAAVVAPAIYIALAAAGAAADPTTGAISGTLTVAHATPVTVTAVAGGVRRSAEVGANGAYRLDQLPPGSYRLEFTIRKAVWWAVDRVAVRANFVTVRKADMPPPGPPHLIAVSPMTTAGIVAMGPPPPLPTPAPQASAPPAKDSDHFVRGRVALVSPTSAAVSGDVAVVTAGKIAAPAPRAPAGAMVSSD